MPTHRPIGASTAMIGTKAPITTLPSAKPAPRLALAASKIAPGTNAIHHSIHASTCKRLAVESVSLGSSGNSPCAANASADNCTSTRLTRASQPASPTLPRRR